METEANTSTKRNFKDSVFRMLLNEPENALAIYNGLNGTNYTDTSQLIYNTLENAVFMNIKNDVSFIIGLDMPLYEHQSTFSPNMPLRDLFYVADLLQVYVKDETLYSDKLITLPTPWFFVFYNGTEDFPDQKILRLSEAYLHPTANPQLELVVTMLNINSGHNEELMRRCPLLKEYAIFVETTRKYSRIMPIKEAVKYSVEDCIQHNILRDFLLRQKAEVIKMSIYEFDAEREWALIKRDMLLTATEKVRDKVTKEVREEITQQVTEQVTQQVTEQVTQQVTEQVTQQVTEQVTQQVTEQVTQQVTELVTQQVTEQVTQQVTEQVTQQVTEQVSQQLQEAETKLSIYTQNFINLCHECGKSKTEATERLQIQFALSKEDAIKQVELYWPS